MVNSMLSTCLDFIKSSVAINLEFGKGVELDADVDEILKSSLVGTLLPLFLNGTTLLLKSHSIKMLNWGDGKLFDDLHSNLFSFRFICRKLFKSNF
jgi:hypothetical protein